jgi:hypothetical protein
MRLERDVAWADCIRVLRRAGFVCAAESPEAVVLVNAGRTVHLERVISFDEPSLLAALRAARVRGEDFLALLCERGEREDRDGEGPRVYGGEL